MAAAFVLGAEGVQMGTRMLATEEAGVHQNFKDAIVAAGDDGTVLLSVPGNPTMRVLRNRLVAERGRRRRVKLLGSITDLYFGGDMEASVANTGQVSARIDAVAAGRRRRPRDVGGLPGRARRGRRPPGLIRQPERRGAASPWA